MSVPTLNDLLKKVSTGDDVAFRKLFHLYKQQVYAYAMHFTRSVSASEEVVQDIFLKLWLHKNNLHELDRFEGYLYTITRNRCFDYLKKLALERTVKLHWAHSAEISEETTEKTVLYDNYEDLLKEALEQLPPQQRKIYMLSLYEDQKLDDIANNLHISRNTVKVHLAKARSTVRNFMTIHMKDVILLFLFFSFSL